ncbi:nucleolar complex-associated protein-domain-containing protein [Halteromyces radiatus]|uniref:nucleolar complex-associated protein-domain-containing protein n=1 Tax=Halteromyces radiatus TaxID=101107 RepID=UPI0022200821|nr:nucleolar complex-associated protein-domain-containing protein [Halteromyces radiatus]KAI8097031.1 nucleolar complex-associated protein-domain-containing protein [Halteromyces radiatus]
MPSKKSNVKKTTKPPTSAKSGSSLKRFSVAPKKEPKNKDYLPVPEVDENDIGISDEDLDFFAENEGFQSFLASMDAKELTRNPKKEKKPKMAPLLKEKKQQSIPEPTDLSSSDEEDYDDDNMMITQDKEGFIDSDNDDDQDLLRDLSSDSENEQYQRHQLRTKSNGKKAQERKQKQHRHSDDDDEKVMDYELQPRKVATDWTRKDYVNKLPIKLPGGKLAQQEEEQEEEEEKEFSGEEEDETMVEASIESTSDQDEKETLVGMEETPVLSKKQLILVKKEELASLATSIQEDPEDNVHSLAAFRHMYSTDNATIKKLTLLAQLAVYKDIIPGYRIRTLTEKETGVQVTKEVKRLREYEQSLLHNYELYLKDLNTLLSKRNTETDTAMALVATRCLCELLMAKPHFNFRLEIMVSVVARMSILQWDDMSELSYKAILNLLESDESGRISLDAVKMITRMIKSKGYVVHKKVIDLFLHLRLMDEMAPISSSSIDQDDSNSKKRKAKDKPFLTKKARKALKETKEIEKEFQEAEAVVSKEEKDKFHTETLKLVFAFYFRILKKQSSSPLLPGVLNGLARFAHLINVDFFNDLLNALRDVMNQLEDTSLSNRGGAGTRKRLLCITTAFELLSGQGEALNYDLKDFYKEIYQILFKATYRTQLEEDESKVNSREVASESEAELLLRGLEMMFLRKRQIPIDRLAAFVKRFSLVALNMPNKTVSRCLILVQRLLQRNPRLDALIQSEDRAATGIYLPLLEDPELCNPFGTSLYELFLYQNHYDPNIRSLAQTIQQQPSTN